MVGSTRPGPKGLSGAQLGLYICRARTASQEESYTERLALQTSGAPADAESLEALSSADGNPFSASSLQTGLGHVYGGMLMPKLPSQASGSGAGAGAEPEKGNKPKRGGKKKAETDDEAGASKSLWWETGLTLCQQCLCRELFHCVSKALAAPGPEAASKGRGPGVGEPEAGGVVRPLAEGHVRRAVPQLEAWGPRLLRGAEDPTLLLGGRHGTALHRARQHAAR